MGGDMPFGHEQLDVYRLSSTKLGQRGYSVREEDGEYGTGQIDGDPDSDPDLKPS